MRRGGGRGGRGGGEGREGGGGKLSRNHMLLNHLQCLAKVTHFEFPEGRLPVVLLQGGILMSEPQAVL